MYAGLAVLLATLAALVLARFEAQSKAESTLADDAAYLADELGRDDLAVTALKRPVLADEEAQLDEFLGTLAAARDVARTSLVSPNGTITYSTDHALIGQRAAALGQGMLESHVPVRWRLDAKRTRGTLVAERDSAVVAAEVRRAFLMDAGLVVLALLLLYVALIPVFHRVTAALAQREARYRSLMEQASDAIFVADDAGRLIDVNERACEILGYSRAELLGKHAMDLMSIGDVAQLPLHMEALQAGKTILVERPIRKKDGAFVIGDVSAKLLEDGRLLASIRDVTHRKQLEDELREAHKVEAVGRFAGGVVDDFATLLSSVSRHAEALERRLGGDADVAEIRKAATSGHSLATQLLAVGSKPAPKPEVIDLNASLVEMRGMLEAVLGERIKLVLRRGGNVDPVLADPAQIENVVVDLALHARAEMRGGGTLTIETGSIEFAAGGGMRHTSEGRHTMLVISDTGNGRDGTNRLFRTETHDGAEHLGLALAAVYGLVNQGGGSIGIESEPGVGTTVRIYLPSAVAAGELGTSLGSAQTA